MAQLKAQVDKLLTNVSQMYIPEGFISEDILPNLGVKQKTGKLAGYGNNHLRLVNTKMGGRGRAARFEPILRKADDLYSIESHGLEGVVTEDDYDNVEEPFEAENDETLGLSTTLWVGKENGVAAVLFDTAVITQNVTLSGTSQFNDYTNSKPLETFRDAQNAIFGATGVMPNRGIMGQNTFNTLKYHPAILRSLGFADNRAGTLKVAEVAHAMSVEILHIGSAAYNTAKLGQTDALAQIWGKSILMYYAPKKAAKYQQSLGYYLTLKKRGPRRVFKYNVNNPPGSKAIIVQDDYEYRLTNVKCAYLIKDAIA